MPTEEMTYRNYVKEKLDSIEEKVTYTNGKVRRITIALVLISGVIIGQQFTSSEQIINFIAHVIG